MISLSSTKLSHSYPPLFQISYHLNHLLSLCNFLIERYQSPISIVLRLRPLILNHSTLRCLRTSTGCGYLSASSTSCAYWFTSAFRCSHRASCRTPSARSRVRNHGVVCAPRHRPISSCRRRDVQQWAQDHAFAVAAPRFVSYRTATV